MLYLWMPEANGVWQWSTGESWSQAASLEQLIQDTQGYHGQEAVVFFPSRDVQMLQQSLAKPQYKKLGADGVKYLLEEFVVLPIDSMKVLHHFQNPDQLVILGMAQSTVETLQHALNLIPVKVISLLPDFLILPVPEVGQTIIANLSGHLLVRESEFMGNSVDDLALFLDYQLQGQSYKISNFTAEQMQSLEAMVTHEQIETFDYAVPLLKKAQHHPFNVLPKAKNSTGVSGYWKACAAVLVAALVVQFGYDVTRWYKYKKVADQTALQAVDQYKYWFGQSSRVTEQNLKSQFESHVRLNKSANTQALQLLSRIGPVLMQNQIVANRVHYEASALNMELKANSSTVLQNLIQQLNQQGFKAELGNIQPNGAGVMGLVKIQ
ncbi:type II secretion system protein GspL [Acinetobacter sp.]|uniref:type II secretion system protein GspL n=1 Tax=Acinetobacter sp. TaxID=472 RepID=UPI002647C3FA|nr:type II secretion system protein GspL [Acinetobacter sp.]MDN5511509.1 type II secretion system protein GspL [Acinetobacter sp.]MDN5524336.1 type II secretion system protein GspL [Acinetobacter sp.]